LADPIPERLRDFVARRAHRRCEYCLLHEQDAFQPHQVDHIISRKHGGLTDPPNLAYACLRCNYHRLAERKILSAAGRFP